jgi:ABC-type multidrug transport system fused ATPase/permease subunit
VVVENGKISEQGNHPTLMALGGTYKRLNDLQSFH